MIAVCLTPSPYPKPIRPLKLSIFSKQKLLTLLLSYEKLLAMTVMVCAYAKTNNY